MSSAAINRADVWNSLDDGTPPNLKIFTGYSPAFLSE
jgi:hypothetical protein